MSSTATSRLRLDKQGTGDNPNAWGIRLNTALDLVDESQGVNLIALNGDVTLTANNYASDQARRFILKLSGTGLQGNAPALVTIPNVDKGYQVHNLCSGSITIGTSAVNAVTIRTGQICFVYCDGAGTPTVYVDDPALDTIKAPAGDLNLNGKKIVNGADGVADTDFATLRQTVPAQSALAKAWAAQPSGEVVAGQGYSALFNANLAKAWATQVSGEVVPGQGYSAYYYAQQTLAFGTAGKATILQATTGTDDTTWMTPLKTAQSVVAFTTPITGVSAKSGAYTVSASDRGKVIDCTGTFTLGTLSAATAGANFYFHVRKRDGSGVVTLDPNAAETIDGRTSISVYQEAFTVWTDGATWYTQGRRKGWVSIAEIPVTGPVATLDFTLGFGDAELRDMEFRVSNLQIDVASGLFARVQKSGAFIATATYNGASFQQLGAATNYPQQATGQTGFALGNVDANSPISGMVSLDNFASTTAGNQCVRIIYGVPAGVKLGELVGNQTTSAAIQAFRFYLAAGSNFITSGTVHQRGFRP